MACGCSDESCNCIVQSGGDIVVGGSGTVADPYIVSFTETEFAGVEGDGIDITPGGTNGHTPEIAVKIDPDSTADVTAGPDGIRVDIPSGDPVPQAAFAPGMMMEWGGSTASVPDLWLPCDGSLVAQATYPDLFSAIGHMHNRVAGVPTEPVAGQFRLPDARKRPTYGPGAGDNIGALDGAYGSESAIGKSHTHTGPAHTHAAGTLAADNNTGTTGNANNDGEGSSHHTGHIVNPGGAAELVGDADLDIDATDFDPSEGGGGVAFAKLSHNHNVDAHGHTVSGSTGSAGTGATSSADSPYLVVEKIIFAGV